MRSVDDSYIIEENYMDDVLLTDDGINLMDNYDSIPQKKSVPHTPKMLFRNKLQLSKVKQMEQNDD